MQLHEMFHNGETKARAAFHAGTRFINPVKPFRNARQVVRRNTLSRILHRNTDLIVVRFRREKTDRSPLRRILHGIVDQIHQNLREPVPVGLYP